MEYLVDGKVFSVTYTELKDKYETFCYYTNEEFLANIKDALHLACIICWFKGIPTYDCLSDKGVIHELVHLIALPNEPLVDVDEIRMVFNNTLRLI